MKKFLFIIILLSLHSFPSLGSVNGKTLLCKCNWDNCDNIENKNVLFTKIYLIFHFEENKVKYNLFLFKNDKIKLKSYNILHNTSQDLITFRITPSIWYELDRETLLLKLKSTVINEIYKCDVFVTEKVKQKMEEIMTLLQTQYDKLRIKNKI